MILSVALCTFNGEQFLKQQLDSIINQSLKVDEIIICDDVSNDTTSIILEEYQFKYPELIKVYFNKKSLGTIKNFEKALSLVSGDLIFLADQDDIWFNTKVQIMYGFFKKNEHCKLLFSNGELIDKNSKLLNSTLWDKWTFDKAIRLSWLNNNNAFRDLINNNNKITGATLCLHKSLKKNSLPIKVPFGYWHDAWLGLHASAINGLFFIEKSLIYYRVHEKQQIGISTNISKEIISNSNLNPINKKEFYKNIRKIYKSKKRMIPPDKNKKSFNFFLKPFLIILKRYISHEN